MRLPGVCIDCRTPVVYDGWGWHDYIAQPHGGTRLGRSHNCIASPVLRAHTPGVEASGTPPHDPAGLPLASVESGRVTLA